MTQPMAESKELIKHHSLTSMVGAYNQAVAKVVDAFTLLEEAKKQLSIFGGYRNSVFGSNRIDDYDLKRTCKSCLISIKANAWRGIFEKSQIENLISASKKRDLYDQLDKPDSLPDITEEVVRDTIAGFAESMDTLLEETVTETFDYLRPRRNEYKTNDKYEVGEKVILNYAIDHDNRYGWVRFVADDRIRSMDNVFHLLDGKGHVKYPGDAVTVIQDAIRYKKWKAETEYFEFKWFKKGSMHIKFKRLDLLSELNRIGGRGLVKREEAV